MERHTFETWQILRRIGSFTEIAEWASLHHETPSGLGYPFRRAGPRLSLPARLVAVADVFQALAQARPYRGRLPRRPSECSRGWRARAGSTRTEWSLPATT